MKFKILFFSLLLPAGSFSQTCCPSLSSTTSVYAGTGGGGYSGDGGPALSATFNNPWGLFTDAAGNVYVCDSTNNAVRKITPGGIISTIAGNGTSGVSGDGGPATLASLGNPGFGAIDSAGNIYISQFSGNRVRKIDASGIITTFAGNGSSAYSGDGGPATLASFSTPYGIAVDGAGNVYISDNNGAIRKVAPSGIISTIAGTGVIGFSGDGGPATLAQISLPDGPRLDPAGNLYFWDDSNDRVRKIDLCGNISTVAGGGSGGMGGPATSASIGDINGGIAFCGGNMYLSGTGSGIYMINSCGIINTIPGSSNGVGLAFDGNGNLFASSGDRIFKTAPDCAPTPTPACAPAPSGCAVTPTSTPTSASAALPSDCESQLYVSQNLFHPKTDPSPLSLKTILCARGRYSIQVYNSAGEHIASLRDTPSQPAGAATLTWDGKNKSGGDVASGVYIIRYVEKFGVHEAKVIVIH